MFRILLIAAVLAVSGCASKEKTSETKQSAKTTMKKAVKKGKQAAKSVSTSSVAETMESITCSYNNDKRKISSVKFGNGGCEVHYEKFGEKKVVATANFDLGYCSQMANKVSNNLEEAGFSCK